MTESNKNVVPLSEVDEDFIEFCRTAERSVITVSPEAYDAFVKMLEAPSTIPSFLLNHGKPL